MFRAGREPQPIGRGLGEGLFLGMFRCLGPPSESPYKEVLSGWVESGLSASLSLLDGANSFASSQHLPSLARIRPVASLTSPSTTFPLALLVPVNPTPLNTALQLVIFCYLATRNTLSSTLFPSPIHLPSLVCFTLLMISRSRGVLGFDHIITKPLRLGGFQNENPRTYSDCAFSVSVIMYNVKPLIAHNSNHY